MTDATRPLAGRQWRVTKAQAQQPPAKQPPAAPSTKASRAPTVSSRAEAEREAARRLADKYITRDGRRILSA
jgi:hypothetical protein